MKIVIDGRMWDWTGIGRYTRELVKHLPKLDPDSHYVVLLQRSEYDTVKFEQPNFRKVLANIKPYSVAEQIKLPWLLYRLRPDLVHFVHFSAPCLYFGRRVVTIHDFTLFEHATHRGRGLKKMIYGFKQLAMRLVFRCAIARSAIITDTQLLKEQIIKRYRVLVGAKLSDRIWPIYLGVDLPASPEPAPPAVKPPYLMYLGTYYPHKNVRQLVEAFKDIHQARPDLKLCLAGGSQADRYFYDQIRSQVEKLGLTDVVTFPGYISDQELAGLYQNASLFVFPSLSEGFGLPPLEAMSFGTPTLVARATTLPEVCGRAADYFDPVDPKDLTRQALKLLDDQAELTRLRQTGPRQAQKFSWQTTAKQTLDVYRQSLKTGGE